MPVSHSIRRQVVKMNFLNQLFLKLKDGALDFRRRTPISERLQRKGHFALKIIFVTAFAFQVAFSALAGEAFGAGTSYGKPLPPIDESNTGFPVQNSQNNNGTTQPISAVCSITPAGGTCGATIDDLPVTITVPPKTFSTQVNLAIMSDSPYTASPANIPNYSPFFGIGVSAFNGDGTPASPANPANQIQITITNPNSSLEIAANMKNSISEYKSTGDSSDAQIYSKLLNNFDQISGVVEENVAAYTQEFYSEYSLMTLAEYFESLPLSVADKSTLSKDVATLNNLLPDLTQAPTASQIQSLTTTQNDLSAILGKVSTPNYLQTKLANTPVNSWIVKYESLIDSVIQVITSGSDNLPLCGIPTNGYGQVLPLSFTSPYVNSPADQLTTQAANKAPIAIYYPAESDPDIYLMMPGSLPSQNIVPKSVISPKAVNSSFSIYWIIAIEVFVVLVLIMAYLKFFSKRFKR